MSPWQGRAFEVEAEVLAQAEHPGGQFLLRLRAPEVARAARPGQFVHLRTSPCLPLRRPISILRADPDAGAIDLYYKVVGRGTAALAERRPGERLPLLGPIGRPFALDDAATTYLLLGGGVGAPPMIFAALDLAARGGRAMLMLGSELPWPFRLKPSAFVLPGIGGNAILALAEVEERGVPCRLASKAGLYGCFDGFVTEMAEAWLMALPEEARARVAIRACGPHPMLHAAARLARRFSLPAELSLEEHMACGIGGCAGCVVRTEEADGAHYRRVCVDGPVFPAEILPDFA